VVVEAGGGGLAEHRAGGKSHHVVDDIVRVHGHGARHIAGDLRRDVLVDESIHLGRIHSGRIHRRLLLLFWI
jgi:hypothetical protein